MQEGACPLGILRLPSSCGVQGKQLYTRPTFPIQTQVRGELGRGPRRWEPLALALGQGPPATVPASTHLLGLKCAKAIPGFTFLSSINTAVHENKRCTAKP